MVRLLFVEPFWGDCTFVYVMSLLKETINSHNVFPVSVVMLAALVLTVAGCVSPHNTTTSGTPAVATMNKDCPIMGGPVDPKLTRVYQGQVIGFCCPGCPAAWDKLTDSEKQLALANAKPNLEHIRAVHEANKQRGAYQ